jgi:lysine/arginine/ornithine transport system substrate-binding protein
MGRSLAVAMVLGGLISSSRALAADLPDIRKRGTLRVLAVVSPEEPYFVSKRSGRPPGFDLELLGGFARLHELKVEVIPVPGWDELIPSLRADRGDLIAGGFTNTRSRLEVIDFTVEVFPTRSVVMTRKPRPVITSLAALKDRRVGTVRGTFMAEELSAAGVKSFDSSIETGRLPEALKAGRIDAAVDGLEAALYAQAKEPDLQLGLFLDRPASLAYGVRKEDRALHAALNSYISSLRRTSTWSRLVFKYFGAASAEILRKAQAQ